MTCITELDAVKKIDTHNLIDIKNVHIDTKLPERQRMEHYIEQIKNPYCFMCGKTLVSIGFTHSEKSIDESLKTYFLGLKCK